MTDRSTPPGTDVLSGVAAISAGANHTCALMQGGGVRCWGGNVFGQLGDGSTDGRLAPSSADILSGAAAVSTGTTHTCALMQGGGVRCWGGNADGELGDGSYVQTMAPPGADVLSGIAAVSASHLYTCALSTAGGIRCWGLNSDGQIGDDTALQVDRMSPATTDVLGGVRAMALGATHVCALMQSGGVRCWGGNDSGQLGNGMAPDRLPVPPSADLAGLGGSCP
jgi:alpha-tubulin suppressor-like RCC1 family protein